MVLLQIHALVLAQLNTSITDLQRKSMCKCNNRVNGSVFCRKAQNEKVNKINQETKEYSLIIIMGGYNARSVDFMIMYSKSVLIFTMLF